MALHSKKTLFLAFPQGTQPHLHIVLTDPFGQPPVVVVVNVCTYHGKHNEDATVLLAPGDHPFLNRESSYVAYDYAKKVDVNIVEALIANRKAELREDMDGGIFELIKKGLMNSKRTPLDLKDFCRKRWMEQDSGEKKPPA